MASKPSPGLPSPTPSSIFLPLGRRSRRGSLDTLSSNTHRDKEALSQALDQIHSSASQSETLTTFNEFASPPPSSSGSDSRNLTGDIATGRFSGLYNRFRDAVGGNTRERGPASPSSAVEGNTDRAKDPPSSQAETSTNGEQTPADPASAQGKNPSRSTSPEALRKLPSGHVDRSMTKPSVNERKKSPGTGSTESRLNQAAGPPRTGLPPFGKAKPATAIDPTLAPVVVTAHRDPQDSDSRRAGQVNQSPERPTPRSVKSGESQSMLSRELASNATRTDNEGPARANSIAASFNSSGEKKTTSPAEKSAQQEFPLKQKPIPSKLDLKKGAARDKESQDVRSPALQGNHPRDREALADGSAKAVTPRSASRLSSPIDANKRSKAASASASSEDDSDHSTDSEAESEPPHDDLAQRSNLANDISPFSAGDDDEDAGANVIQQIRSRVLSKDFWMRDENWTCGQIFDAKCTSLVPGERFGYAGNLRVCKPCKEIIVGYYDDLDDSESETESTIPTSLFHYQQGMNLKGLPRSPLTPEKKRFTFPENENRPTSTPMMAIPATRRTADASSRRSAVLEINPEESPSRPGSSRSFKSSMTGRSPGHKRHRSRQQLARFLKSGGEDRAPFHQTPPESQTGLTKLPAFHHDNIIDPDLAPYMSDEGTSEDEQPSILAAINGEGASAETPNDSVGNLLSGGKRQRPRTSDRNSEPFNSQGRDDDEISISSNRTGLSHRPSRKRNTSFLANLSGRPILPSNRSFNRLRGQSTSTSDSLGNPGVAGQRASPPGLNGSRMVRSASMKGATAPPIELNSASLQHVRKLLRQLLEDTWIENVGAWEQALIPILLRCTDDVNPDVHNGDDIDIRHYVKFKKIPGGKPADTSYLSGVVFTKNLALKSMPRNVTHPNIMIITFPIEYQRQNQQFQSLEPVIAQETEHLRKMVNRIVALNPQVLLVQRNISGLARQYLAEANISTAFNVKPEVLEAVARCAEADILSSIDRLALRPARLGKCTGFDVKTYVNKDIPGGKKTFIYFSGCEKELGCTIVLRGADMRTLRKIKRITEFMVYVVYNLKLETCLMRDEFVLIPTTSDGGTAQPSHAITNIESRNKLSKEKDGVSTESGAEAPPHPLKNGEDDAVPDDVPMPTFYGDMVEKHQTKILSASPFVKFMQPYLLMRAREQERRLAYLKKLRDQDATAERSGEDGTASQKFSLIRPEMVQESARGAPKKVMEILHAVHESEYDKALYIYETQKRQWESYIAGNINLFDPFAHQNIAVLYTVVCTSTTIPCAGPDMLSIAFYDEHNSDPDFDADCTLGQYVEELCLGAEVICSANGCEKPMLDHHRSYVHGEARVTVFVEKYPCKIRGLQDSILMWSYCKICQRETQIMPMSESTWKYSFGKFLELSFWSKEMKLRAGFCPHDLHRDHLRYFGFKDYALRIHYDSIQLLEIIVPRARITWKVENDLQLKNDLFRRTEERMNRFMNSVKSRVSGLTCDNVLPEKAEDCKAEIERLSKKANEEHTWLIKKLQKRYMNSKHYEILPLNRAVRTMQEKVAEWDSAFADFERSYFPSEKDIRRLAALQLKRIFLDRDESVTSLTSTEEGSSSPRLELDEKQALGPLLEICPKPTEMDPEKAHTMLTSVIEEQASVGDRSPELTRISTAPLTASDSPSSATPTAVAPLSTDQPNESMPHLDLAVPSSASSTGGSTPSPGLPRIEASPVHGSTPLQGDQDIAVPPLDPAVVKKVEDGQTPVASQERTTPRQTSGIPRPRERSRGGVRRAVSPTLLRAHSQPTHLRSRHGGSSESSTPSGSTSPAPDMILDSVATPKSAGNAKSADKRPGLSLSGLRSHKGSLIPRSTAALKKDSGVINLVRHFEQLTWDFQRERIRERRHRAASNRKSRGYPMASAKPIVEVYKNVHEAVEEREPSDDDLANKVPGPSTNEAVELMEESAADQYVKDHEDQQSTDKETEHTAETTEAEDPGHAPSQAVSDTEFEASDIEHSLLDELQNAEPLEGSQMLSPLDPNLDIKLDLPKHERTSLMKMLTNFWAERSASGWSPLEYPLNAHEHVFLDSDVIVREDEPSSLIAFALGSEDYRSKLANIRQRGDGQGLREVESSLLSATGTHLKYQFQDGPARMQCKIFYAEQFDAVQRQCGVSDRLVDSLSRCVKWDSKGGKTKSVFLKTLDERLVLKSLSPVETQAFLRFAPAYFQIMSKALFQGLPSVIAKMLGFYQIVIKNPVTGIEIKWDVLVMENLFYDRTPTRIFDLKGSMRNRKIQSTGEQNEVLLDENMVEFIYESPLFAREHSKNLLRNSVWNDTLFLASQNVMDYSLMIAIDEVRRELVVGIIDCIRTYTWDKKLESWIKARGFAGGNRNEPTVTSPKEYKSRFREAMARYVLQAPNCWHQFQPLPVEKRPVAVPVPPPASVPGAPGKEEHGEQEEAAVDRIAPAET